MEITTTRKQSLVTRINLENSIFVLTLLSLLGKSITFYGFVLNTSHLRPRLFTALKLLFSQESLFKTWYYIGFLLVFLSFSFLFKGKGRIIYCLSFNFIFTFLLLVDLWYLRGFGTMPSFYILQQTANLDNLSDSVLSLIYKIDFLFIVDIVVFAFIFILLRKAVNYSGRSIKAFVIALVASILMIALPQPITKTPTMQIISPFDANETSFNISPLGFHIYSTYTFVRDSRTIKLTDAQKQEIEKWYSDKQESLPDNKYKGMFKGKNVIYIQVESLEKFVIGQKINGQEITPVLNNLIKKSIYFDNFHEQINQGSSSDADLLANTSVYPLRVGSTFFRYPTDKYKSMPEIMKKMGYYTVAAHPDKGSFWNWMPALDSMGFDKTIDFNQITLDEVFAIGPSDASFLRQMGERMTTYKQPFYSFNITLTSHMPFLLPDNYKKLKLDPDFDKTYLGGYFQCVNYTDSVIGDFINQLKKSNLLDNSVIVIYGDHQGVHRFYDTELKAITPKEDWWQENHHETPFIIYNPSMEGETIHTNGGQIDILPTISYLMGVDESEYVNSAMGRNLFKTNKDFAVLSDGTYVGKAKSDADKQHDIKGLEIADLIIRSNYFADKK